MRLRTASGISNLRLFAVGALAEVNEAEPNSDFAQPQKIALDTTVNGVVQNEDVDYFLVEAKKGERITAEIEGDPARPNALLRSLCGDLGQGRFELARSDDAAAAPAGFGWLGHGSRGRHLYRPGSRQCLRRQRYLPVSAARRALSAADRRAAGRRTPGETLEVHWLGDVAGERVETRHVADRPHCPTLACSPTTSTVMPPRPIRFAWSISATCSKSSRTIRRRRPRRSPCRWPSTA